MTGSAAANLLIKSLGGPVAPSYFSPLLVPLTRILASSSSFSSSSFTRIPPPCPSTSLTTLLFFSSLAHCAMHNYLLFLDGSLIHTFPPPLGNVSLFSSTFIKDISVLTWYFPHTLPSYITAVNMFWLPNTLFWSTHSSSTFSSSLPCRQMSHSSRLNQFNSAARTFSRLKLESEKIFAPIVGASEQASKQSRAKPSSQANRVDKQVWWWN